MNIRNEIYTENACKPGSLYSQGVSVDDWIFVSGQGALDIDGKVIQKLNMKEQAKITMDYINEILVAGGSSLERVAKVNAHITDYALFADYNEIYKQYFSIPFPARTTVVSGLAPGMLIEVDVIAKKIR